MFLDSLKNICFEKQSQKSIIRIELACYCGQEFKSTNIITVLSIFVIIPIKVKVFEVMRVLLPFHAEMAEPQE